LFLSSNGEQWASLVFARIGTGAVHIFTTSLVGWGLASAWGQRRYLRLAICYAVAVGIHGLWNGLTLLTLGSQVSGIPGVDSIQQAGKLFPIALVSLAFLCMLMIWIINRFMKRAIIASLPLAVSETDHDIDMDEV
jgi:hypothetical protein